MHDSKVGSIRKSFGAHEIRIRRLGAKPDKVFVDLSSSYSEFLKDARHAGSHSFVVPVECRRVL
jgi:hypothetical protein